MFTGLVSAVGAIRRVYRGRDGLTLSIRAPFRGLALGESIAVDGACLTVRSRGRGVFGVHVVDTTLDRTLFRGYRAGQPVNLERALKAGDPLGGHLVQGHVDGIGTVRSVTDRLDARLVELDVPAAVAQVTVPLGSVTLNGVSLTVLDVGPRSRLKVSLIPFTLEHTTLDRLVAGTEVHLEADLIGKYIQRFVRARTRLRRPRRSRS